MIGLPTTCRRRPPPPRHLSRSLEQRDNFWTRAFTNCRIGLLVLYIFNKHKHLINMSTSELESSLIRLKYGRLTASFCWCNIMPYHIKTNSGRVLKLLLHYWNCLNRPEITNIRKYTYCNFQNVIVSSEFSIFNIIRFSFTIDVQRIG